MLALAHLGVREPAPPRNEDRVPPEPLLPPRLGRYLPPHHPLEDAYLPTGVRDRDRAHGAGSPVLAGEHPQDAFVSDAREKPLGQRPRQTVPGPDDEPRVLDDDGIRWSSQSVVGRTGFVGGDLGEVEGL